MADTKMDLTGHTPRFGRRLNPGNYLVVVDAVEYNEEAPKGQSLRFTFKSVEGESEGGTVAATLYIINDNFTGSKGHRGATLDNWFHLLEAVGFKPGKFDAVKIGDQMVGKRLGVEVVNSDPVGQESKIYANVNSFFPASAMGDESQDENDDETGLA